MATQRLVTRDRLDLEAYCRTLEAENERLRGENERLRCRLGGRQFWRGRSDVRRAEERNRRLHDFLARSHFPTATAANWAEIRYWFTIEPGSLDLMLTKRHTDPLDLVPVEWAVAHTLSPRKLRLSYERWLSRQEHAARAA